MTNNNDFKWVNPYGIHATVERSVDKFETLLGKTLGNIIVDQKEDCDHHVLFICDDGSQYILWHEPICCESVWLESIDGDLSKLLHTPLTMAEVVTESHETSYGSQTFSFYKLATIKGYVTLRWCGESNGYYSEEVDFGRVVK